MKQKTLREDRTAAAWKYVAKATRRRRRILQAGFFFKKNMRKVAGHHGKTDGQARKNP